MKKVLLLLITFCLLATSFAAFEIKPVSKKAAEIFLPIGKDNKISLMDLSTISVKDFEKLTGRELKFFDRLAFKGAQKKLRNSISNDGTITNKRLLKFINADSDGSGFNIGGFLLGFFLGLIGVLIAYLINNDNNSSRRKWSWIGFGVAAVISLIVFLL